MRAFVRIRRYYGDDCITKSFFTIKTGESHDSKPGDKWLFIGECREMPFNQHTLDSVGYGHRSFCLPEGEYECAVCADDYSRLALRLKSRRFSGVRIAVTEYKQRQADRVVVGYADGDDDYASSQLTKSDHERTDFYGALRSIVAADSISLKVSNPVMLPNKQGQYIAM